MTLRTAKVDGFKFSINGVKVQTTVKGENYDIPDDLYDTWQGKQFEKGKAKSQKSMSTDENKSLEADENK